MIRLIIVAITVIGFLILSIPILFIEWIIGKFSPRTKEISSLRLIQGVFKLILWEAGTKVTIIGEENVPKDTPVLYIGNHRSYFDIVLSYSRCPIRTGYIAKKEMERYPLLSNWMRYLHCLFLDRKDIKQGLKTILTAIEKVKSGISICIFPEGTRNANADELELLPFHEGSFKIASKSGCAIIPIAMNNTAEIFEAHMPKIKSTHVVLEYGKPIYVKELSREDLNCLKISRSRPVAALEEKSHQPQRKSSGAISSAPPMPLKVCLPEIQENLTHAELRPPSSARSVSEQVSIRSLSLPLPLPQIIINISFCDQSISKYVQIKTGIINTEM